MAQVNPNITAVAQAELESDPIAPYEYDDYYNTRVNRPWGEAACPFFIGVFYIFLGIMAILFTSIDISRGAIQQPYYQNPNYGRVTRPSNENANLAASYQEHSIWPTLGKGIWVGLIMMTTGILAIVSRLDGSWIGVHILNILSWINIFLSLFLILSSIMSVEVYPYNLYYSDTDKTSEQMTEYTMNILIIIVGTLAFILSLVSGIYSCVSLEYCVNGRLTPKYSKYATFGTTS